MDNRDYRQFVITAKSNHSYAQANKIVSLYNSSSWRGKRCFIIGGGESLQGFDFGLLQNELTIGINRAFEFCPNLTINYSHDSPFYDTIQSNPERKAKWEAFKGHRVFLTPMEKREFGREVYLVRRAFEFLFNQHDLDYGIFGGRNSGYGAIMLAVALGCTEIYLLGYDMVAKEKTHWHNGYFTAEGQPDRTLEEFNTKLAIYRNEIDQLFPHLNAHGVKVFNLNENSQLKRYPFAKLDEVLKYANV